MTTNEILSQIHAFKEQTGHPPKSSMPKMGHLIKESQRKIGGWRKVLWLAGAIPDERNRVLPRFNFAMENLRNGERNRR